MPVGAITHTCRAGAEQKYPGNECDVLGPTRLSAVHPPRPAEEAEVSGHPVVGGFLPARELLSQKRDERQRAPRRGEVAVALVETPARMVVGVFRGVGRGIVGVTLSSLAWRWRGVVGVVCLVQSVAEGRIWPGLLGAVVIALSYLVPAAGRAIEARAAAAADAEVVAAGLGEVLVEVLGRSGQRLSRERRQQLQASPRPESSTVARPAPLGGPARHLHLVRK